MLAATWITVPDEGTDFAEEAGDDVGIEDTGTEETGAEVISAAEEVPTEDEAAAGEEAAAAGLELLAEGEAVLDELQAASPTARTAATAGTNMDRRNIESSPIWVQVQQVRPDTGKYSGVIAGLERCAKLTLY